MVKPQYSTKVNYDEQFKVRPRNNASRKHEVIKQLIVLNLMEKYKHQNHWIRIYTEHLLGKEGNYRKCDVYFENVKENEVICYEVQLVVSSKWLKETTDFYNNYEQYNFKTDWLLLRESMFSDDIYKLDEQIKKAIA